MNHFKSSMTSIHSNISSYQIILLLISCVIMINGQQILLRPELQVQQYGNDVIEYDQLASLNRNPIDDQLAAQGLQASYMYLFAPNDQKFAQDSISANQVLLDRLRNYYLNRDKSVFKRQGLDDAVDNDISGPINDPSRFEIAYNETSDQQLQSATNNILSTNDNKNQAVKQQQDDNYITVSQDTINQVKNNVNDDDEDNEIAISQLIAANDLANPIANAQVRSEYIDYPLLLTGHQYVQGGAGEGKQLLGPDGTFENIQVVKSDNAIPSYCDPPNPCPIGYTTADGCLEEFVNSASFSRDYQANQQCSCDNEHSLFNCAAPVSTATASSTNSPDQQQKPSTTPISNTNDDNDSNNISNNIDDNLNEQYQLLNQNGEFDDDNNEIKTFNGFIADDIPRSKLETIARTIKNRFGGLESFNELLAKQRLQQQQQQQFQQANYLFKYP